MNKTSIEWTTFTANPVKYRDKDGRVVWACVKTSPGCANCYSEALARRYGKGAAFTAANMRGVEPFFDAAELHKMRTAKVIGGVQVAGSRCFVGDMTDVFGEWVSDELLNELFSGTLELRTDVTWQILTKRAERMRRYLSWRWGGGRIPCRHIHVGVSVENQAAADERIPLLLQTPARVRFLSVEPLLGPVDLTWVGRNEHCGYERWNALTGEAYAVADGTDQVWDAIHPNGSGPVRWVIVGGESGPSARPCQVEWVRSLVRQCKDAGTACFVKQLGSRPVGANGRPFGPLDAEEGYSPRCWRCGHFDFGPCGDGTLLCNGCNAAWDRLSDSKGGDPSEWAEDLRVRQLPR